jgi:hypothetical protein
MRTDNYSGYDETYDMGYFQLVEQQRRKQNYHQHNEKYLHRLCH